MLRLTEIGLQFPKNVKVHSDMGSVFHGALMELTSPEAASRFHEMQLRPYSQCVYWDKERWQAIWRIGTLNDYAYEQLVMPLSKNKEIHLKQKNMNVGIQAIKLLRESSFSLLASQFVQAETAPAGIYWHCLSPMSFKQKQRYVILPNAQLMYQSLLNRWNTFSREYKLEAPDLVEQLVTHCMLTQYQLKSCVFSVEASRIYAGYGSMRYRFFGYDMLKRLQGLLGDFAEFSGIGIKTALGMGAVRVEIESEQRS